MLADLIAAKAEDAPSILSTSGHANIWPTLDAKTVDIVKLASLAPFLRGKPPDDEPVIQYMKTFRNLANGGDEGPWIDLLPADLVEDLANLQADQIQSVAAAWTNTEEAKLDRWNAKDTASFLREMAAFAGMARAQERMVLLWVSPQRRLTIRWSGPPPAWHLAREAHRLSMRLAGQAPPRRRPAQLKR